MLSGRNSVSTRVPINPAAKYAARLLYSQVDLGSDDDDTRSNRGGS